MVGSWAGAAPNCEAKRDRLRAELGPALKFDEPLGRHSSFRIGGPADFFLLASGQSDLKRALRVFTGMGIPVLVLGGGTNVLVSDLGVRGAVVKLGRGFARCEWGERPDGETELRAGAAARIARLAAEAARRGLTGLEFAEGIPGTVGGAMIMNAGAFGGEMSAVVVAVEGLSLGGEEFCLSGRKLRFGYRRLELPTGSLITAARFCLRPGSAEEIRRRVAEIRNRRRASQPLDFPNAGSVFKNPPGESAGRLIEAAGLKGVQVGGAQVSRRHGNFIVNRGGATAADVAGLIERVRSEVDARFGVRLELEVKMVGEWRAS